MTSATVLNATSMLILMIWLTLQWRTARTRAEKLPSALIAVGLPAIFLAAANSGVLSDFSNFPPPFVVLPISLLGLACFLAFSKFGDRILSAVSLAGLVGFHSFRVLAEIVIYLAVHEGIAPVQMSFEGWQFDIVTGLTAIPVAIYLSRNPSRKVALAFNYMGLVFLGIILFIAVTSMPLPFRLFMDPPDNTWVTRSPYILLPGVLVTAAFTGHFLIFRKLKDLNVKRTVNNS